MVVPGFINTGQFYNNMLFYLINKHKYSKELRGMGRIWNPPLRKFVTKIVKMMTKNGKGQVLGQNPFLPLLGQNQTGRI